MEAPEGEGRKMASVLAALTSAGSSGTRQHTAPTFRWFALLLMVALGLVQVSAVEVYTPTELTVVNGTEALLKCTFTSSETINSYASVTWGFQEEGSPTTVSFFYYSNGKAYPGKDVLFKDRISWAGDFNKKDASIRIANMQFLHNGIYICDVKNPPDIVVVPGEIQVRVVKSPQDVALPCLTHLKLLLQEAWKNFLDARCDDDSVKDSIWKRRVLGAARRAITYLTELL